MRKPGLFTTLAITGAAFVLPACSGTDKGSVADQADPDTYAQISVDCAGAQVEIDFDGIQGTKTPGGKVKSAISRTHEDLDGYDVVEDNAIFRLEHPNVPGTYLQFGVNVRTTDFQDNKIDSNMSQLEAGIITISPEQFKEPMNPKDAEEQYVYAGTGGFTAEDWHSDKNGDLIEFGPEFWQRPHPLSEPVEVQIQPMIAHVSLDEVSPITCAIVKVEPQGR